MKNYYKCWFFFSLATILFSFKSCFRKTDDKVISLNKNSVKEINIDDKNFKALKLDTLIKINSVKFIKLETTDKSLFEIADNVFLSDSSYIVVDKHLGFIGKFSKNGKFIKSLGSLGRGPNEFIGISDIQYNKYYNTIDVFDNKSNNSKLIKYDVMTGEPLKNVNHTIPRGFNAGFFTPTSKNSYAIYSPFLLIGRSGDRFGYLKDNKIIYESLPFPANNKFKNPTTTPYSFYSYQDSLRFFERFIPVVYTITENGLRTKYKFNFKSSDGTQINIEDPASDLNNKNIHKKSVFLGKIVETKKYLFMDISTFDDKVRQYCIYDLYNDTFLGASYPFHPYLIEDIKISLTFTVLEDELLVATLDASDIIEAQNLIEKEKRTYLSPLAKRFLQLEVRETDSPVLMLMELN